MTKNPGRDEFLSKKAFDAKMGEEQEKFNLLNQSLLTDKFKTEMCVKFQQLGACPYGKRCNFAHGENELKPLSRHPLYKTRPCIPFIQTKKCPYGRRCNFIHSIGDPRNQNKTPQLDFKPKKYKTRPCVLFAKGQECPYGERCNFIHDRNDPRNLEVTKMTQNNQPRNSSTYYRASKWKAPMTGTKHPSGCWNISKLSSFECARHKVSQGYLNFKASLGTGPLPEHVLVMKDNKQYVNKLQEKRREEMLLQRKTLMRKNSRSNSSRKNSRSRSRSRSNHSIDFSEKSIFGH
jgi:butyrate response factor 1